MLAFEFPEMTNLKDTWRALDLTVSCWFKEVESGEGGREKGKEGEKICCGWP